MTLPATATQPITSPELVEQLYAMSAGQQNAMRYGHDAYINRRRCFFLKWPTTKAEAEALCPDYLTNVAPGQYAITELGLAVYRAYLHQPIVPPDAGSKPQTYHGTRLGRNYRLRDMWETKLPANGVRGEVETPEPAAPSSPVVEGGANTHVLPEAVELRDAPIAYATCPELIEPTLIEGVVATPTVEPVVENAPAPAVAAPSALPNDEVQLDLTGMLQALLAQIAALETKLAQLSTPSAPQPQPRPLRRHCAAMPMAILV